MILAGRFLEAQAREIGFHRIAGLDEAGRGCLAGPVVAAAVILGEEFPAEGLRDSKQLSPAGRRHWYEIIRSRGQAVSFACAEPEEIDRWNILEATRLAMKRALSGLEMKPDILLIDAVRLSGLSITQVSITKGDQISISIAAASIIAKVERDRIMENLDSRFPGFDFGKNKGYPTAEHRRNLAYRGACPVHRRTFRPVRELLEPPGNGLNTVEM